MDRRHDDRLPIWFGDLALRVGFPDGQELAGRTATFVYIPVSVIAAIALTKYVNSKIVRKWRPPP